MQNDCTISHQSVISTNKPQRRKKGGTDVCPRCEVQFILNDYRQVFCSRECYKEWWKETRQPEMSVKGTQKLTQQTKLEHELSEEDVETLWGVRAEYWQGKADAPRDTFKVTSRNKEKDKERPALVLSGHGVLLRVDHGALYVRNGFTHYPQKRQEWRLFPGDRKLPGRILLLDSDGTLTLDVIGWLRQQDIPLILLNWQGEVISAFGDEATAADPKLRTAQIAAQKNGTGLLLSFDLVRQKIIGSINTLTSLPSSVERDLALIKMDEHLQELEMTVPNVDAIRWVEGRTALTYFTCWQTLYLRWKGTSRQAIPEEWKVIGQRGSMVSGWNKYSNHPMNSMLNYAYAILESQVRIAAVSAGLDPSIGYLHACRPGRVALVYDLMEPLRPEVDRILLKFVRSQTFSPSDFSISPKGVCRLHPQLARTVATLTVNQNDIQRVIAGVCTTLKNG